MDILKNWDLRGFEMQQMRDGYKISELGEIPSEWETESLGGLVEIIDGDRSSKYPKQNDIVDEGVLFLNTSNIKNNRFDFEDVNFITKEKFEALSKGKLQRGDIVITLRGSIGNVAVFNTEYETGFINAQMAILRKSNNSIDTGFLYMVLVSDACQKRMKESASGSAQPQLPLKDLKNIIIPVPPIEEQMGISDILLTVDQQIEQNNALIEKVKVLKKGLMQRLLTKGIGHTEFKDTQVGRIPKEWEVKIIGNICTLGRGRVISKKEIEDNPGEYPVYSSQTSHSGCMGYLSSYDFEGEYVTWTTDGVNAGTCFYRTGKFNCTNVCGTLKLKVEGIDPKYLSLVLNNQTAKYVVRNGNPKLMNNIMSIIPVPIPANIEEQQRISEVIFQCDEVISSYESKRERLIDVEKSLMATLLTGKIRVRL